MQDDASQKMTFIINFPKDAGTACSKNIHPFRSGCIFFVFFYYLLSNIRKNEQITLHLHLVTCANFDSVLLFLHQSVWIEFSHNPKSAWNQNWFSFLIAPIVRMFPFCDAKLSLLWTIEAIWYNLWG